MAKTYNFDDYVTEARTEPFRLSSNGKVIEIEPPLSEALLQMDMTTSPRRVLQLLCGDAYAEVYELVAKKPGSVLNRLLADMMSHFGAEQVPPGGGFASPS